MEEQSLEFLSSYRERRPKGRTRFLFWVALALHVAALAAVIVVPLFQVDRDVPELEPVTAFLVRPLQAPPPPPPPPPSPARVGASEKRTRPRFLDARFAAPVAIPAAIPMEDFGGGDSGVPGGVEGGIPGGLIGGIVGDLADLPPPPPESEPEPVRLDLRREEATPIARVEPIYPNLAALARVQGVVILEVLVDTQGVPSRLNVLRSVPVLESAAIDAVQQWRWKPYKLVSMPVPFWVTVTVNFRLT